MIVCGDALDELKKASDDSVDSIITDPPYGYSFMGKDWDKVVPSVEIWEECLRVLKPGGWCMVMASPRQDVLSRMMLRLDDAGFRTDFTSIYWTYASGFPKASNISKMVDKKLGVEHKREFSHKNPAARPINYTKGETSTGWKAPIRPDKTKSYSNQAKELDGSYCGFQPKPAVEVIIVAMKPLSEKTFAGQAMDNGKGITWMDDCRIPYKNEKDRYKYVACGGSSFSVGGGIDGTREYPSESNERGRFPANLLVSDDVLEAAETTPSGAYRPLSSRVRKGYFEGCGVQKGSSTAPDNYGDGGSFSRYFDLDAWDKAARETFPFLIVPKPAKSEKNKGPDANNHHPTVKPLKLMRYLITLTTREGDTVLDPFVGSGTTCVAAKELNREYIGIEREAEYVEIAKARVSAAWRQPSLDAFADVAATEVA